MWSKTMLPRAASSRWKPDAFLNQPVEAVLIPKHFSDDVEPGESKSTPSSINSKPTLACSVFPAKNFMSGKPFLDTNVVAYALTNDARKKAIAEESFELT